MQLINISLTATLARFLFPSGASEERGSTLCQCIAVSRCRSHVLSRAGTALISIRNNQEHLSHAPGALRFLIDRGDGTYAAKGPPAKNKKEGLPCFSRAEDELGWTASSILIARRLSAERQPLCRSIATSIPQAAGDLPSPDSGKRDAVIADTVKHIDKSKYRVCRNSS